MTTVKALMDTRLAKHPDKKKIVLIGGSAGSLNPLKTIIGSLSPEVQLAVVIAQHLDPTKQSNLIQLLRSRTAMPVEAIVDGMTITPGRVYVVTPGDAVTFRSGEVRAQPSAGEVGAQHVIDRLALSLASDQSVESVLVILSGSGNDGCRGAAQFMAQGLGVIAQSPTEAQFPSMPAAIIDKQMAAEVLTADAIAESLASFAAADSRARAPARGPALPAEEGLEGVIDLLRTELDRDFSDYRSGTLSRRLQRRMTMHDCASADAYCTRFAGDITELQHLADDFLIGVTGFYRDPEAFEILRTEALPALFEGLPPQGEFRAWVVGCSTGEEVYSLVALLKDYVDSHGLDCSLKIFATDADSAAIEFARVGSYDENELAALPPGLQERYFEPRDRQYQVRKSIRESVVFATHNVITDTPFSNLHLVLCRNLIIYLNSNIKNALLRLFHFSLRGSGVLFLGSSESIGRVERHFTPLSAKWRIYRRNDDAPRRRPDFPLFNQPGELRLLAPETPQAVPSLFGGQSMLRRVLEGHGPAQLLIDELDRIVYTQGDTRPYLQLPRGEPTEDLLRLLVPSLQAPVRRMLNRVRQQGRALESDIWLGEDPDGGPDPDRGFLVALSAASVLEEGFEGYLIVNFSRGPGTSRNAAVTRYADLDWTMEMLRQEVDATREDMQQTIQRSRSSEEVLRQANEQIMAMNEEFQSANEELEASKEEMQSLNDELSCSNGQLEARLKEIEALNSDLENVFKSSDNATLIVDGDLRIRRFTPNILSLMRLRDTDRNRSVGDITRLFEDPKFITDIRESIAGECTLEADVESQDGRSFIRRILPYLDAESRVAGAVVNFIDVSQLRASLARDRELAQMLRWQAQLLDTAAPILGRTLDGRISFWNRSAQKLWGYSAEEALGKHAHRLLKTRFPAELEQSERVLVAEGHWRGVVAQSTKEGRVIDLATSWTLSRVNDAGDIAVSEVYQDLSVTVQLRGALQEKQELFHLLLDWTMNAEYWTDDAGSITYMTPVVEDITGYPARAFTEDPQLLGQLVLQSARDDWVRHISPEQAPAPNSWRSIALPIRRRDGAEAWIEHRYRIIYSSNSEILGLRGTIRDVDEVRRLEGEAHRLAYSDALTGLLNRRSLADRLEEACAAGDRSGQYSALIMLDLDHFKLVNDTDGHPAGDLLLVEVAERLGARLRAFDAVARVGGDEFMLVLNNLGKQIEDASLTANRICNDIRQDLARAYRMPAARAEHHISASFGLVMFAGREKSVDTLLRQADMALYSAKEQGRNRVMLFDPTMQSAVDERMKTEQSLMAALQNDKLQLFYQAQTDAQGSLLGAEALLRWLPEAETIHKPGSFMSALEGQPMVVEIGKWVLTHALAQLAVWNREPATCDLALSINVSAGYLLSEGFQGDILAALEASSANPNNVVIEITENSLLTDIARGENVLRRLAELGMQLALDDFGTGYSSLSHLKALPINQLKIDCSFVAELPGDSSCRALIESTIAIGKALNLSVVAEGVETREQLAALEELGCEQFQGYLFSTPLDAKSFACAFLERS